MVTKYGFSIIGPISMDSDNNEMYLGDGLFRKKPLIAENTSSRIDNEICLLYTSPSPRDYAASRMPSSA